MPLMPFHIISIWIRGLLSIGLLVLGPYLLYRWYRAAHVERGPFVHNMVSGATLPTGDATARPGRVFSPDFGLNGQTVLFVGGLAATLWALPTGPLNTRRLMRRKGADEPNPTRDGQIIPVARPGGGELRVEAYGPADGQPIVFTHGWGMNSTEWYYAKRELAGSDAGGGGGGNGRFRVIVWDIAGTGLSAPPPDNDYSMENLARDLDAVINAAGGRPAVVVGHSIGGMIAQTYCRLFPGALGTKVCGLVLCNTTYTNPIKTTKYGMFFAPYQKTVVEPLLHLMVWLSPLMRLMNWLSYLNGSSHRSTERRSFSGNETRGQLDFAAGFGPRESPAVLGRGMLAMLRYDARDVLPALKVPALLVAGDKDPVCHPAASQRIRNTVPTGEFLMLGPARHLAPVEHHGKLHEAIATFAARCGGGGGVATDSEKSEEERPASV